jgi:hypothetical protein
VVPLVRQPHAHDPHARCDVRLTDGLSGSWFSNGSRRAQPYYWQLRK